MVTADVSAKTSGACPVSAATASVLGNAAVINAATAMQNHVLIRLFICLPLSVSIRLPAGSSLAQTKDGRKAVPFRSVCRLL
jgi:hypothetical protein